MQGLPRAPEYGRLPHHPGKQALESPAATPRCTSPARWWPLSSTGWLWSGRTWDRVEARPAHLNARGSCLLVILLFSGFVAPPLVHGPLTPLPVPLGHHHIQCAPHPGKGDLIDLRLSHSLLCCVAWGDSLPSLNFASGPLGGLWSPKEAISLPGLGTHSASFRCSPSTLGCLLPESLPSVPAWSQWQHSAVSWPVCGDSQLGGCWGLRVCSPLSQIRVPAIQVWVRPNAPSVSQFLPINC